LIREKGRAFCEEHAATLGRARTRSEDLERAFIAHDAVRAKVLALEQLRWVNGTPRGRSWGRSADDVLPLWREVHQLARVLADHVPRHLEWLNDAELELHLKRLLGKLNDPAFEWFSRDLARGVARLFDWPEPEIPRIDANAPWRVVMAQITEPEHAIALMRWFEQHGTELCANGVSIAALELGGCLPSERALASYLADHLNAHDGDGVWSYEQFYGPMRGIDATAEEVRALAERCSRAGVELRPAR
jgi:hypothetical protein